jgi:RNA polymerase sigma-70 factor (ECF subfamily)
MQTAQASPRLPARPALAAATADAELTARAANGDHLAFGQIMRRHNRLLFRTARSILKTDADAEEAVQEAYLRAWRALSGFRADAKLSTWLVRIVINEALGRLRRRSAQVTSSDAELEPIEPRPSEPTESGHQQPEPAAMRAELRRLMEARIDRLPDAFRTVFMLRAVEEMSVAEVSAALDLSEATVRTRFFRARAVLREGLSRDFDPTLADAFSFDGKRCDGLVARVLAAIATDKSATPPFPPRGDCHVVPANA